MHLPLSPLTVRGCGPLQALTTGEEAMDSCGFGWHQRQPCRGARSALIGTWWLVGMSAVHTVRQSEVFAIQNGSRMFGLWTFQAGPDMPRGVARSRAAVCMVRRGSRKPMLSMFLVWGLNHFCVP